MNIGWIIFIFLFPLWCWANSAFPTWLQHYQMHGQSVFVERNSVRLHYRLFCKPGASQMLVVSPGRTEAAVKYLELIHDWKDKNFSMAVLDHRGQGASSRVGKNLQMGHVEGFNDYVDDFRSLIFHIRQKCPAEQIHVLAHSMGGAIALLAHQKDPSLFHRLTLSSPMLGIYFKGVPDFAIKVLLTILSWVKGTETYALGQGNYDPQRSFEGNSVTHSLERFNYNKKLMTELFPEQAIGGASVAWVQQAMKGAKFARVYLSQIDIPTQVFFGGEDSVVADIADAPLCSSCSRHYFPSARHEILMEVDKVREEALKLVANGMGQP